MGNCVRRETGLEYEDKALHEVRINEIQNKIMTMKNIWVDRLKKKENVFKIIDMKREIIQKQLNESDDDLEIKQVESEIVPVEKRNAPRKISNTSEADSKVNQNSALIIKKHYDEDLIRETEFKNQSSSRFNVVLARPSVKKLIHSGPKLKLRNLVKEDEILAI